MIKLQEKSLRYIISLILIAVAILFGLIFLMFRDDIFQSIQDPKEPFQTYEKPIAPEYDLASSWMALPDLSTDPFKDQTLGDVFVIAPAVYRGGEHWNLPVDDDRRRTKLQRIARPNYVDPYASAGRLFAPYYRQSSLYTFMTNREDAKRAQDFAYQDVKRAFRVFLENSPPERPLVLAGHGQGASHLQRLLAEFFQGDLVKRLAVAYVIDHPLPLDKFKTELTTLKPCETETDTKCIVAYGAFMPNDGVLAERFVSRALVYDSGDYRVVQGRPLLCTNPLLWNRSTDYAPRRLHKGGIAAEGIDPDMLPAPLTKQTGAQCQDGILEIDKPRSRALRRPAFKFGGKFRTLPSNIFYEDLRINAQKRVETLFNGGTLPKRIPLIDGFDVIDVVDSPVTPIDESKTPIKPNK